MIYCFNSLKNSELAYLKIIIAIHNKVCDVIIMAVLI